MEGRRCDLYSDSSRGGIPFWQPWGVSKTRRTQHGASSLLVWSARRRMIKLVRASLSHLRNTQSSSRFSTATRPTLRCRQFQSQFSMPQRVAIVGSGNWGMAIAKILGANVKSQKEEFETAIKMWVFEEKVEGRNLSEIINESHENPKYLPGHKIPENIVSGGGVECAALGAEVGAGGESGPGELGVGRGHPGLHRPSPVRAGNLQAAEGKAEEGRLRRLSDQGLSLCFNSLLPSVSKSPCSRSLHPKYIFFRDSISLKM